MDDYLESKVKRLVADALTKGQGVPRKSPLYTPRPPVPAPPIIVKGEPGEPGKDAPIPSFKVGTVAPLPPGSEPTAVLSQDGPLLRLDLGIPAGQPGQSIKGEKGDPGQSIKGERGEPGQSVIGPRGPMPTIDIEATHTLPPGDPAQVEKKDTPTGISLVFKIPEGRPGRTFRQASEGTGNVIVMPGAGGQGSGSTTPKPVNIVWDGNKILYIEVIGGKTYTPTYNGQVIESIGDGTNVLTLVRDADQKPIGITVA